MHWNVREGGGKMQSPGAEAAKVDEFKYFGVQSNGECGGEVKMGAQAG